MGMSTQTKIKTFRKIDFVFFGAKKGNTTSVIWKQIS